jgi:hypothetical protein
VPSTDGHEAHIRLPNRTLRRYSLASTMAKALMTGGVFLLARDPRGLAQWYQRHLGWELGYLADESAYYVELYYSEVDRPDQHQHLVFAIMPGDPGDPR